MPEHPDTLIWVAGAKPALGPCVLSADFKTTQKTYRTLLDLAMIDATIPTLIFYPCFSYHA